MVRQLKVFAVSFLLACLFCSPAYAEFSSSDSLNLSNIRSDVSTIRSYISYLSNLGNIQSYLNSISSNLISYLDPNSSVSFAGLNLSKLDSLISRGSSISSQLDLILSSLGDNSKDFNTDNALYCFDSYHFSGTENSLYPGMIQAVGNLVVFNNTQSRYLSTFLPAGRYVIVFQVANLGSFNGNIIFESNPEYGNTPNNFLSITNYQIIGVFGNVKRYMAYFDVPDGGLTWGDMWIGLDHDNGYACAYIYEVSGEESIVSANLNPSIDSHGQQLDQGVNQLEDLESTAFESLDTSIGSLDFSASALGQVVSGFTFIRAVFSAVYSSSPYISVLINLSCMLGVLALFLRVQPRFSRWEREHRDRTS